MGAGLRFSVLSSGSTGNATLVSTGEQHVLIDVGLSVKRMDQLFKEKQVQPGSLSGVLITHEHSDHIKGLGAFYRKYRVPIFANEATWRAVATHVGEVDDAHRCVMETGDTRMFGGLKVESFPISHDAAEPVAYSFWYAGLKLSVATDLGYMSDKVKASIQDSDALVLESNHDIEMLRMGKYPWNVKRRILGDSGHLSNEAAGLGLCEVVTDRTKRVYLAHLSRDHNMIDLARMTVQSVMEQTMGPNLPKVVLKDTYYDRATDWDVVAE